MGKAARQDAVHSAPLKRFAGTCYRSPMEGVYGETEFLSRELLVSEHLFEVKTGLHDYRLETYRCPC